MGATKVKAKNLNEKHIGKAIISYCGESWQEKHDIIEEIKVYNDDIVFLKARRGAYAFSKECEVRIIEE